MRISILDFGSPAGAIELAPAAERLGYHRYWLGEHHSKDQCANPLLLGTLLAGLTERIRVGTGGVCLTYSKPYRVAEDARLANYLFPDRFDLGVTRGMGYPAPLHAALGGGDEDTAAGFEARVGELHGFLTGRVAAGHPLAGTALHLESGPPLWVLGTSLASARLAARLGAGLCVSLHHRQQEEPTRAAADEYTATFVPSPELPAPATIAVVSGICADDGAAAEAVIAEAQAQAEPAIHKPCFAGGPDDCAAALERLCRRLGVGEIMVLDFCLRWEQRIRMYELLAGALGTAGA